MIFNNREAKELLDKFILIFKKITIWTLSILFFLVIWNFISILISDKYTLSLCLSNQCIENVIKAFSATIKFGQAIFNSLVTIVTIGGIFLALLSYINNYTSNVLNNHIAHLSIFKDYITSEIQKRDYLDISAFDIFKLYNIIYDNSKLGDMNVSTRYIEFLKTINNEIYKSNEEVRTAKNGSFLYAKHQHRMISATANLGINMQVLPRNDFLDVENEIMSLLDVVNQEFCKDNSIASFDKRHYI